MSSLTNFLFLLVLLLGQLPRLLLVVVDGVSDVEVVDGFEHHVNLLLGEGVVEERVLVNYWRRLDTVRLVVARTAAALLQLVTALFLILVCLGIRLLVFLLLCLLRYRLFFNATFGGLFGCLVDAQFVPERLNGGEV